MASVHRIQRKPERARAQYSYLVRYRRPDRSQGSKTFKRKVDADRFAASVETDKSRDEYIDPRSGQISVEEWSRQWLKTKTPPTIAPTTYADYESVVRHHVVPKLGHKQIRAVLPLDIERILSGVPGGRAERVRRVLLMIFSAAVNNDMLARNPTAKIKSRKRSRKEMAILGPDEITLVADNVPERYRPLVYLLAYGGLRWGEAAALKRGRCNLLRNRVEVVEAVSEVSGVLRYGATKSYQNRSVAIPPFLRDMLAKHLANHVVNDPSAFVFTTEGGAPIRNANFRNRVWLPALERAGLPRTIRIHDLRHTCASLLIAQGANPKLVQLHLGHSQISVTFDTYAHLMPDAQDEIAVALDGAYRGVAG